MEIQSTHYRQIQVQPMMSKNVFHPWTFPRFCHIFWMQSRLNSYPWTSPASSNANAVPATARSTMTKSVHNQDTSSTDDTENGTISSLRLGLQVRNESSHLRSLKALRALNDGIIDSVHEIRHDLTQKLQIVCLRVGNTTVTMHVQWSALIKRTSFSIHVFCSCLNTQIRLSQTMIHLFHYFVFSYKLFWNSVLSHRYLLSFHISFPCYLDKTMHLQKTKD